MAGSAAKSHWERVYSERDPRRVSWYESTPKDSLRLVEAAGLDREAPILDLGGGTSTLAASLLEAGHTDVTVADISRSALDRAQAQAGTAAAGISWIEADVRDHDFGRLYALWHDRAVFHFMVDAMDRRAYVRTLRRSLRAGAQVIVATFGPAGPERCSGLPVARHDARTLEAELGACFEVLSSEPRTHTTPAGVEQEFVFTRLRFEEPGRAGRAS